MTSLVEKAVDRFAMDVKEIKRFYAKDIVARKEHWCFLCGHFAIEKGDKYHKIRVDAHLPYSKSTRLKCICMDCAEKLIVHSDFPPENIIKNWKREKL